MFSYQLLFSVVLFVATKKKVKLVVDLFLLCVWRGSVSGTQIYDGFLTISSILINTLTKLISYTVIWLISINLYKY